MEAVLVNTEKIMTTPPSFAEIDVQGADAASFLQSQLANDVRGMSPGQWHFGAYCQVDGRVQSLFLCACLAQDHFRLLLPADNMPEVEARLTKFRIRARCTISARNILLDQSPCRGSTTYQCAAFAWTARASDEPQPMSDALWTEQLALGVPWIFAGGRSQFLPAMLALERLQAFSLRKGCYPGQEILARTHYLGRNKRRLARLATGNLAPGMPVLDAQGNERAIVVCSDAHTTLAVVQESAQVGDSLSAVGKTVTIQSDFGDELDVSLNAGTLVQS